ncbi:hypothetical protein Taro_022327 [Colocasia esculenta]|uniref:Uncharacterized protein n=1 Tax=Colocasia esculenta TaxID=4460 RepID=A0A843V1I2_COLES|nr:hypothetical protein [Colocasia esculenta]
MSGGGYWVPLVPECRNRTRILEAAHETPWRLAIGPRLPARLGRAMMGPVHDEDLKSVRGRNHEAILAVCPYNASRQEDRASRTVEEVVYDLGSSLLLLTETCSVVLPMGPGQRNL